jgi:pyrroline-5-carboxylate reductase
VTAVSGSGPAYFFHIVELMIETAVNGGLEPDVAGLLVSQTLFGAARMISETDRTPTELRVQVTSPGGTTQAAIETMTNRGMRETIEAAIQAATMRGVELGRMSES